ncbi:MAG: transcriptional regulator [Bacillales bacterium]|jgi:AcrR family transcriptional regulator|nr:transcriptional regulator [Bacillales bacterium]
MSKENLKEREIAERKQMILDAAKEIISLNGLEDVSIRKIAKKIGYSPAIVYHYFQSKEEIIGILMQEGYRKIVQGVSSVENKNLEPVEKIRGSLANYIRIALDNPEYYKYIMLNNSENILKHTSVLFKGASLEREAISKLCILLQSATNISLQDVEIKAQIIWTSTYGLIIRLIIESELPISQKDELIEQHLTLITKLIKNL